MKDSHWQTTIVTIVIAFAIGGASGVLGTALTSSYLSDYAVQLSELTAPLRLSQERPRNFPSSYKEAIENFTLSSLPSIAEVYSGKENSLGYTQKDRTHIGIVLTSDGWVAVHVGVGGTLNAKGSMLRIRGQMYPVVKSVYDAVTETWFVKVDASGLPVAAFGNGSETQIGEQVFVAQSSAAFVPVSITQHLWPEATLISSDEPNRLLSVDQKLEEGQIVFNLNGEIIAFVQDQSTLLPFEALSPSLRSLLEKQQLVRPSLGVHFIDLSHAVNISTELSRSYRHGALLYGVTSVTKGGVAANAGLQSGDILVSINGELIDAAHGLDELVAQYRSGDKVQIAFDRNGSMEIVEVILGEKTE